MQCSDKYKCQNLGHITGLLNIGMTATTHSVLLVWLSVIMNKMFWQMPYTSLTTRSEWQSTLHI